MDHIITQLVGNLLKYMSISQLNTICTFTLSTEFFFTLKSLTICSDVLLIWVQSKHFIQVEA